MRPDSLGTGSSRHFLPCAAAIAGGVFVASLAHPALAKPGTHGPSISSWDTRASSVEIGFRPGFLSGGHFDILSYSANFTATNGILNSQFGIHYLNVRPGAGESVMHGLSATAIALFDYPVADRFEDGTPKAAVAFYIGAAPAALVSGRKSFVSIPFPIGLASPWSPARQVSITPWFEIAPGVNLDTEIKEQTIALSPTEFNTMTTPTGTSVALTDSAINKILDKAVDFKVTGTVGMRAGLDFAFRLDDSVDFAVNGMLGSLGGAFGGTFVGWVGGGLVFRWDKVVPAVLPPDQRLLNEDCTDVEARYRACRTTGSPNLSPAPSNVPPPSAPPAYPQYPQYNPPPPSPAAPPPSPAPPPPGTGAFPPPNSPPAPAPGATPGGNVPTSSFPR
jgi:hypothetical protein